MTFGVSDEKAVQVYGAVLAAGDTLLAAYTAVIDVAEEALKSSNKAAEEVQKLTKGTGATEEPGYFARPY